MNTDHEWERWGQLDPYFGVITHERFRRRNLDADARREFFDSGRLHVEYVLAMCRTYIDAGFEPQDVMDFGCGVGRVVVPFAARCRRVVGLDVSPSMLEEARRNFEAHGVLNAEAAVCGEDLSAWHSGFDLVHSCIVLQHIEPARVRLLFEQLLRCLRPGGIGALQLTYAKAWHAQTYGRAPDPASAAATPQKGLKGLLGGLARPLAAPAGTPEADPGMQMYSHDLNAVLFLMQRAGVTRFHVDFTDHGGELGVFLFFRMPTAA